MMTCSKRVRGSPPTFSLLHVLSLVMIELGPFWPYFTCPSSPSLYPIASCKRRPVTVFYPILDNCRFAMVQYGTLRPNVYPGYLIR
ncbi:hypothetical protein B0J13DRAFT_283573 [Dactylonectria estremocensis]|uniref:Secreted protein n=1 Tax=Dactylonectria estremocensis TaxID=1079267 RepID=A0A9P9EYE7_9HYPO|nr:hypothetical protein B0J13DRAFT_283573 [Dactylonectria estremocensis]